MRIFKGILFFKPQTLQKQTNNLFDAGFDFRSCLACVHETDVHE